jgi:hypothetical protein
VAFIVLQVQVDTDSVVECGNWKQLHDSEKVLCLFSSLLFLKMPKS